MRSLERALIQYDWCPYKKGKFGDRHTPTGRMLCEDEDRDWGDPSTSQGTPKIASKAPETEERHETDSSSQRLEGTNPADTLILDF